MQQNTTLLDALPQHLVLYDGECGLCDHTVQFLLDKDQNEVLHYSPLQGEIALNIIQNNPVLQDLDSILYVRSNPQMSTPEIFWYSTAIIEICKVLPFPWNVNRLLFLLPRPIRDWGYKRVAQNRIRFFGSVEHCRLPTPSERSRFL